MASMTKLKTLSAPRHTKLKALTVMTMLGFALTACAPTVPGDEAGPTPSATSSQTPAQEAEPTNEPTTEPAQDSEPAAEPSQAPESNDPKDTERAVVIRVEGDQPSALVKTVIVTSDGKEEGGQMISQNLPFTHEVTLSPDQQFTKILVLGKYPDGKRANISCSIEIDGVEVSTNSSTTNRPAECLVLEK